MADLNIAIKIAAQDQASGVLGRIGGALKGLTGETGLAGRGFGGLQTAVMGVMAGGMTLLLGGMVAVGGAAFGMANDVQAATALVQGQLGLGVEEAEAYGDVIKDVYGANFGESVAAVGTAVGEVSLQLARLGEVSTDVVEGATVNAFRLADAYGVGVTESTSAAVALMDEFGLSQQQAFDFLTTGFQRGMNSSDDFLDSIGEYGPQFAGLGFDAAEFFSVMETGMASGVLGTDKIADSVKEWGIIMTTEAGRASSALDVLGMDYDAITAAVGSGDAVWADYFDEIVGGLQSIEDPVLQQQTAIALFGTMAEDMGAGFLEGLDMMATGLGEMEGATASLDTQYNTLGSALEGFKRQGLVALEPIGAVLLTIANFILPYVQQGVEAVGPIFERVGAVVSQFLENLDAGITPVAALSASLATMVSPEVADQFDAIVAGVQGFLTTVGEVLAPVAEFVTSNVQLSDVLGALGIVVASIVLPALAGIVVAAAPVLLVAAALIAGIALVRTAWEGNWGGIQEKTAIAVDFVKGVVSNGIEAIKAWWAENGDAIMAKALEIWTTVSTHVSTGIENAKTIISNGIEAIKAWWAENGDAIMAKALEIWTTVSTHVGTGIENAKTLISEGLAAIKGWWEENGAAVTAAVTGAWAAIKGQFKDSMAASLGGLSAFLQAITGDWEGAKATWSATVGEAWTSIKARFSDGMAGATAAVTDAWPTIKQAFLDGFEGAKSAVLGVDWGGVAATVISRIAGAFANGVGMLADAARAAAQAALDAALGLLGGGSGGGGTRGSSAVGGGGRSSSGLLAPLSSARFGVPALAGVGVFGGGGGGGSAVPSSQIIYNVTVDARGSSASAAEIERAVERALRKAGATADQRMRAGVK